jgi:putative ABC transport system permease protein
MNLAWRDVQHGLGRFILTCIGLSLLLGVVMGMTGIYRGLLAEALGLVRLANADVWVVEGGKRGPFAESSRIPRDTRDVIAAQSGVAATGAIVYQTVEIPHQGKNLRIFVVGAEIGRPGSEMVIVYGRGIVKSRTEIVADHKTGLMIDERIRIGRDDFTVVGLMHNTTSSGGDPVVMMTLRDAQIIQAQFEPSAVRRETARTGQTSATPDQVNAIIVRLKPLAAADMVTDSIKRWKHLAAMSGREQEDILTRSVIEKARRQIGLFTGILLIVSTVVIGLIVYTMTLDKKKAIATLKLIGAPDRTIVALIIQQALAMGLTGFAIGAILIRLTQDFFPRRLVLETSDTIMLFGIIIIVCLLASVFGVRSALKIDPASALGG